MQRTRGGILFPRGLVMDVVHTYRGRFGLRNWKQPGSADITRVHSSAFELVKCRVCGCDHLHACRGPDGPCSWSTSDPELCTACEGKEP